MPKRTNKSFGQVRPVFERLMIIYGLLRDGRRVTVRSVAAQLEVSYKTVHRDFEFLRDRIGMPVYWDRSEKIWKTDPSVKLPWVIRANEADKL